MKGRPFAYFIGMLAIQLALLLNACPLLAQDLKSKSVNPSSGIPERRIPVTAKGPGGQGGRIPIRSAAGSIAVNENTLYNTYTPEQLVKNVLITGCLTASNIQFHGLFNSSYPDRRQLGYFEKATSNFPIDEGLILSTGYVTSAEGPNNSGSDSYYQFINGAGDVDLTSIAGRQTHDAAVLSFDFVPAGNTLEFQYIFSSEEYLEFVGSAYNDAFGFFLSGPGITGPYNGGTAANIALMPVAPFDPVSINTVNPGSNPLYYVNNPQNTGPYHLATQFDGMTVVMTATYAVQACQKYHIKLAVGDAQDFVYNSAVFLKARSFNSEPVGAVNVNASVDLPDYSNIFEGCGINHLILTRDPANIAQPARVYILYGGSATNGVDVVQTFGAAPLPVVVDIPANVPTYDIPYIAVDDGFGDAGENLVIQILQSCPCDPNPVYLTKTITIYEQDLSVTATGSIVSCGSGNSGFITANALHGSGDNLFSRDLGVTWQTSNLFTGLAAGTYSIWAKNVGGCQTATTTITLLGANPIVADAGPDFSICNGESAQLQGSGGALYSWSPQAGLSDPEIPNPFANPTVPTTYTVTVRDIDSLCPPSTDDVFVDVKPSPVIGITPFNRNICIGSSIKLTASGGGTYEWNLIPIETTAEITKAPLTSTSYTVIVTGANGCKVDSTANVTVHPLPTAVLSGGETVCSGSPATLTVNLTGTPPWNITYLEGATPHLVIANTPVFSFLVVPATTTTYTLQSVQDFFKCDATTLPGSATVTVTPIPTPPTAAVVNNNNFCPGAFLSITLTASGGTGTSVKWYSGSCKGFFVGTGNPLTIAAPLTTTTYYASNVNSCGISGCPTASVTVNILTPPTPPTSVSTPNKANPFCIGTQGGIIPYILQAEGAGTGSTGFQWFKDVGCGVGSPIPGATGYQYTLSPIPTVTTTYYVRTTNVSCGASACASIQIVVFPTSIGGSISSPATVCSGTNTGLLTLSGNTGNILRWESNTGSGWNSIGNAGNDTYAYSNITQTTRYRAVIQSGTGANACPAVTSSEVIITVNPLPVPTISGPVTACLNSTNNIYTTQAGMNNYLWSVSAGGTITAGGGVNNNTITITWITVGPHTVSVNYTNGNNCTAVAPTVYSVTVNSLPVPSLSGPSPVCMNSTGNVYTTDAGMSNYVWNVSAGGTITAGGGATNNTVTITWNTAGPHTVSVNYTNGSNCIAALPTVYNVTVNSIPIVTLNGPSPVCINSTGNIYTTEAGMSNYIWAVSAGGTITAGGTTASNTVTVTWNTAGAKTIFVNYTNGANCTAASPSIINVIVSALPVPALNGPSTVCEGSTSNTYTTDAGMTGYSWMVAAGGTITAGTGTSAITVTWSTPGSKTVSVNYNNPSGCAAVAATVLPVTVNPLPIAPVSVTSPVVPATYCRGSVTPGFYYLYANDATHTNQIIPGVTYEWFKNGVCGGSTPIAGATTSEFPLGSPPLVTTVYWARVTNSCGVSSCASFTFTVNQLPTITLSAIPAVCTGSLTANLPYTATANGPDKYSIVYSAAAIMAGFTNITNAPLTASPIVLTVPAAAPAASYSATLTVKNSTTGCGSINYSITVTISAPPTITLGAFPVVCSGTTTANLPYTAGTGSPNQYSITYSAAAITAGFTNVINAVLPASPIVLNVPAAAPAAVYTATMSVRNSTTGCGSNNYPITITVSAPPTITLGAFPVVCAGTITANLPYTASTGSPNQYSITYSAAAITAGFTNVINAALPATPIVLNIPAAAPAAVYTATMSVKNSSTGCGSINYPITIAVSAPPTITLGAFPVVCSGATTANLPYSASSGSPDQYSIVYSPAAIVAGFVNITNAPLTASPIMLTVPAAAPATSYSATLYVKNSTAVCGSIGYAITITVGDTQPPVANCKDITVYLDVNGNATITGFMIDNGSTDNCGIKSMTVSPNTFNCINVSVPPAFNDLIISEYVEGNGTNKNIEIYNGTTSPINLNNYKLQLYTNGSPIPSQESTLSGILGPGATKVYKNSGSTYTGAATIDNAVANFSGDDAIAIYKISSASYVDIFGKIGDFPVTVWTLGGNTTVKKTLRRKSTVNAGITTNPAGTGLAAFATLASEWDMLNVDDVSGLGTHTVNGVGLPVTLTVTDFSNLTSTCNANVTVLDNIAPTALCHDVTVSLDAMGNASITPALVNNGSSDNCTFTTAVNPNTFNCSNLNTFTLPDLIISEYVEGSSNNKYIEIFNGTGTSVNLSNYKLRLYANGAITPTNDIPLSGTLANGATIVYSNSNATIYTGIVTPNPAVNFNGNDAVALWRVNTNSFIDIFGRIGNDPGTAWTGIGYSTLDKTLRRKPTVTGGITTSPTGTGTGAFTTLITEWDIFNTNDVSGLGSHGITVGGITPVLLTVTDNAGNVSTCNATVTIQDNILPFLTCPSAPAPICSAGSYTQTGTSWDATATDNCGTPALSYSLSGATSGTGTSLNGKIFGTGVTTVTWTATDSKGNVSTCSFAVTIIAKPADPTLIPASVCSGTMPQFTAGNGSIYEFFVNNVSQGLPSSTPTFIPTVPLVATQPVCVRSYANPVFTFDGILNEAAWGQPIATSAGGPVNGFAPNRLDAIYMQSGSGYLFGAIAGNLVDGGTNDRILMFIDSKTGGYNKLSDWTQRSGAPHWSIENLNSGIIFDPGFSPDYILEINRTGGIVYYDLYDMTANKNIFLGNTPSTTLGFTANTAGDYFKGFEFAIPRSALGNPTGSIQIFPMIVDRPNSQGELSDPTFLSNQFLTHAGPTDGNYQDGAVTFSAATPNPITVTLSNEGCYSEKCVIVNQTPTTSAIYHQ